MFQYQPLQVYQQIFYRLFHNLFALALHVDQVNIVPLHFEITNKYFENQPVDCSYFSGLLPEGQDWFSPKEIGAIIGRSDQYVRNTFYSGKILIY